MDSLKFIPTKKICAVYYNNKLNFALKDKRGEKFYLLKDQIILQSNNIYDFDLKITRNKNLLLLKITYLSKFYAVGIKYSLLADEQMVRLGALFQAEDKLNKQMQNKNLATQKVEQINNQIKEIFKD